MTAATPVHGSHGKKSATARINSQESRYTSFTKLAPFMDFRDQICPDNLEPFHQIRPCVELTSNGNPIDIGSNDDNALKSSRFADVREDPTHNVASYVAVLSKNEACSF